MILRLAILTAFAFCASLAAAAEKSRPMAEMHGGCENYKANIKLPLELWGKPAEQVAASAKSPLALNKRVSLELLAQSAVSFVQKPGKEFPIKGKRFAGLFSVRAEKDGFLNVASGSRVWFDLIGGSSKKIVDASEFEMQTGCDKIAKIVRFPVVAKTDYIFQVSSSAEAHADFIFIPADRDQAF